MSARRMVLVVLAALALVATPTAFAEGIDKGFAGLGADAGGFDQAIPGTPLVFPRDFGAHPGFRTEWWYLTANLQDEAGAAYGVQWTLFRQAGAPGDERQGWANQTVWMGHAAVTTATEHLFAETFARGGVEQAGVTAQPFRAWIDDWIFEARQEAPGASLEAPGSALARAKISANGPGFRYAFDLAADKPLVLHGDNGFSRKSDDGRASYYFSQPFFKIDGVLVLHGRKVELSGLAWMDREWSSQPLLTRRLSTSATASPSSSVASTRLLRERVCAASRCERLYSPNEPTRPRHPLPAPLPLSSPAARAPLSLPRILHRADQEPAHAPRLCARRDGILRLA